MSYDQLQKKEWSVLIWESQPVQQTIKITRTNITPLSWLLKSALTGLFLVPTNWFRVPSWILRYNENSIRRGKFHHIASTPTSWNISAGFLSVKFLILILCWRTHLVYSCYAFQANKHKIFFKSQNSISNVYFVSAEFSPKNYIDCCILKFSSWGRKSSILMIKSHHHQQHLHNSQFWSY